MKISKAFVITLPDSPRKSRWDKVITSEITLWPAVDARYSSADALAKYNFNLQPTGQWTTRHGKDHSGYFSKWPGGVGVYLSHWLVWNNIKNSDPGWFLILEDDVIIEDVMDFINNGISIKPQTNIVNLNKRGWNGAEAYLINNETSDMLINITNQTITAPVDVFMFYYAGPCKADPRFKHEHHRIIGLDKKLPSQIQI